MPTPSILIIGGGIAGLTAAIALRKVGFSPRVVEQTSHLSSVGAGITIQANASAVLAALGVTFRAEDVISLGTAQVKNDKGMVLASVDPEALDLSVPAFHIHRADLQATLVTHHESLGGQLERGRRVMVLRDQGTHVDVIFEDGEASRFDLVLGADGINSTVRRCLFGSTGSRYSGQTCWRFAETFAEMPITRMVEYWSPGRRVGLVPLSRGRVYAYLVVSDAPGTATAETTTVAHVDARFRGVHADLDVLLDALIAREAAGEPVSIHHDDLRDQPHISFGKGRVALLGDAAHAITPNLGQGAGLAIEDAGLVAIALASGGVELERLHDHLDGVHRSRVQQIQTLSWRLGAVAHWTNPMARAARDLGLSLTPASATRAKARKLYGPGMELARELEATVALHST